MEPLLILALYILFAAGLGWLVYWGGAKAGVPETPRVIIAAILFIVILLYGLNQTGVLVL